MPSSEILTDLRGKELRHRGGAEGWVGVGGFYLKTDLRAILKGVSSVSAVCALWEGSVTPRRQTTQGMGGTPSPGPVTPRDVEGTRSGSDGEAVAPVKGKTNRGWGVGGKL